MFCVFDIDIFNRLYYNLVVSPVRAGLLHSSIDRPTRTASKDNGNGRSQTGFHDDWLLERRRDRKRLIAWCLPGKQTGFPPDALLQEGIRFFFAPHKGIRRNISMGILFMRQRSRILCVHPVILLLTVLVLECEKFDIICDFSLCRARLLHR
jgi:hypothetical protein